MSRFRSALTIPVSFAIILVTLLSCSDDDNATNNSNHAPVITSLQAEPDTFYADSSCIIIVTAQDADGDDLAYAWETPGSMFLPFPSGGSILEILVCCPIEYLDSGTVISVVSDSDGAEARDSIRVWVLPAAESAGHAIVGGNP
jgi:hypothetical protein